MNCEMLKKIMIESGDTQERLGKKLGLSKMCVNLKVNNKYSFTLKELVQLCKIYKLSSDDLIDIFFDDVYKCDVNNTFEVQ